MATVAEVCKGGYGERVSSGCPGPGDVFATFTARTECRRRCSNRPRPMLWQLLLAKEIERTVGEDGGENRIAHGVADRRMRVSEWDQQYSTASQARKCCTYSLDPAS
jgi:hypothetical protein